LKNRADCAFRERFPYRNGFADCRLIIPPSPKILLMKQLISFLVIVIGILAASHAQAANQQALANVKGCLACHDLNNQKIGPSFIAIARKYADQKGVADKLVQKVLEGGTGVWGDIPEPASKTMGVTETDARKLVKWILGLKTTPSDVKK
jgi:cytochrome c